MDGHDRRPPLTSPMFTHGGQGRWLFNVKKGHDVENEQCSCVSCVLCEYSEVEVGDPFVFDGCPCKELVETELVGVYMKELSEDVRKKVADAFFEASQDLLEVYIELQDNDVPGAKWVELVAVLYECMTELVDTEGAGVQLKLEYEQGKKIAEAHIKMMKGWNVLRPYLNNVGVGLHESVTQRAFAAAVGDIWTMSPVFNAVKPFLPGWLWPDHPDNGKKAKKDG